MDTISRECTPLFPYLHLQDRTPEINDSIQLAFNDIVGCTGSEWGVYNGSQTYALGGIKEHKFMKKIIQQAPPERKDFYALDIGAGNFQWGRGLSKYLNTKKDIPKDITIHIIGIRGETNLDKAITEHGQCKLYEFGQFQIENLVTEFQKHLLQLINKVDLIVSRWCFRHLVDPVGTFMQAYDLLYPKTGHLMLDGFFFLQENESMHNESLDFNEKMTRLCTEIRAPFLRYWYDLGRSLDHFVINKPDDHPCHLHKQYLGIKTPDRGWQIGSGAVTQFKELKKNDTETIPFLEEGDYRGDKEMYERFRQDGLLHNSNLIWGPLEEKDTHKKTPQLHIAIASGNEDAINQCLNAGFDIHESDETGATPLHLAVQHYNYELFSRLLTKKVQTKLFASGYTLLHLATKHDFDGRFIKALIKIGADINIKSKFDRFRLPPLGCAIMYKNIKAIELLLSAKVTVDDKTRQLLETDPDFSSVWHLLVCHVTSS